MRSEVTTKRVMALRTAQIKVDPDTGNMTNTTSQDITISVAAVNDLPAINALTDFDATQGTEIAVELNGTDEETDWTDFTFTIAQGNETTIGDVLQEINSRGLAVTATINATGDGILLTDTGGGPDLLTVAEVDNGTIAAGLGILGSAA